MEQQTGPEKRPPEDVSVQMMKDQHTNDSCQDVEPLLSALLDDELSEEEAARVDDHLSKCVACRQQLEWFSAVDGWTRAETAPRSSEVAGAAGKVRRTWARPILAVAAGITLVIALPIIRAPATIKADDVIEPLVTLEVIQQQQGLTRQSMFQTMELDLRALTLELQGADIDVETRRMLMARIESLGNKLEQFESMERDIDSPKSNQE